MIEGSHLERPRWWRGSPSTQGPASSPWEGYLILARPLVECAGSIQGRRGSGAGRKGEEEEALYILLHHPPPSSTNSSSILWTRSAISLPSMDLTSLIHTVHEIVVQHLKIIYHITKFFFLFSCGTIQFQLQGALVGLYESIWIVKLLPLCSSDYSWNFPKQGNTETSQQL